MINGTGTTNIKTTTKLIFIFLYLILTYSILKVYFSQVFEYEYSIYAYTPLIFWVSIGIIITYSTTYILYSTYISNNPGIKLFYPYLLIFLSAVICLSLNVIHGYEYYGISDDPGFHFGTVKSILSSSHLPENLVYPFIHIYTTILTNILGVHYILIINRLPILFHILFIFGMCLFVRKNIANTEERHIAYLICCSSIYGYHIFFTPNILFYSFIPMILITAFHVFDYTTGLLNKQWFIPTILFISILPIFHPIGSILFLIIIFISGLFLAFINLEHKKYHMKNIFPHMNGQIFNILIIFCTLIVITTQLWFSNFYLYDYTIINIHDSIIQITDESTLTNTINQMDYANSMEINIFELFFKYYGNYVIISLITFVGSLLIINNFVHGERNKTHIINLVFFFIFFAIAILLAIFKLPFGATRFLYPSLIFGTIICAFTLNMIIKFIEKSKYLALKVSGIIVIIVIIITIFYIGIITIYPSDFKYLSNPQTLSSEIDGMDWFFINSEKQNENQLIGITVAPGRMIEFLYTPSNSKKYGYPLYLNKNMYPPFHFGYDNQSQIGNYFNTTKYLILTQKDITRYTKILTGASKTQWNLDDFSKLDGDNSINLCYNNSMLKIYQINPIKNRSY